MQFGGKIIFMQQQNACAWEAEEKCKVDEVFICLLTPTFLTAISSPL